MTTRIQKVPPPCRPGDKVLIVAPASPFQPELLHEGCARLREWGLEPVYGPEIFSRWGYLAGDDEIRKEALVAGFVDPSIKAILCARGGYGTARLVEHLPWGVLEEHPKRFFGFSDITFLHLAFAQRCSYVTFHGPMVASRLFLEGSQDSNLRMQRALFGQTLEDICPPIRGKCLQGGQARGRLLGGNLSLVATTLGTPWQPDFDGAILCLEDVDERPYSLDRLCQHLHLAGVFEQIGGLVLGDFGTLKDQYATYDAENYWRERLHLPLGCPILYDVAFGHIRDNITLPIGAEVELDAHAGWLRIASEHV